MQLLNDSSKNPTSTPPHLVKNERALNCIFIKGIQNQLKIYYKSLQQLLRYDLKILER